MKPAISAIALIVMMATSHVTSANSKPPHANSEPVIGEITVTNVNTKAVRDFTRQYRDIDYAKWYSTGKGYSASFDLDGRNIKVVYDANGNRRYSITSYTEQHLGYDVRDLVKRNYYDYQIIGVNQFDFETGKTVYVIKMTDAQSNAITLKVAEGDIERM